MNDFWNDGTMWMDSSTSTVFGLPLTILYEAWKARRQQVATPPTAEEIERCAAEGRCVSCGKRHNGEIHRVNNPGLYERAHYMCVECYELPIREEGTITVDPEFVQMLAKEGNPAPEISRRRKFDL